jgi:lipopolysaccharide/colanic/teichoic acid biosynthesis glycosyltransferase
MKPGMTGLWQLLGNGAVNDFESIVKLDCEYMGIRLTRDSWNTTIVTQNVRKVRSWRH